MHSFYSLIRHQDEITDLVFVHGFDIALSQRDLRQEVSSRLQEIAGHFGKNLIEVETNLKELLGALDWECVGHGPAIAAVAHILSSQSSKIYVPATHSYAALRPWASHPLLDHLWTTESLDFVHDGCALTRPEKIDRIKNCEILFDHLRVCLDPGQAYNCGRCEKCLRTMVSLEIHGVLDRCRTFELGLDLEALSKLVIISPVKRDFLQQNIEVVERQGGQYELAKILRKLAKGPGLGYKIGWRLRKFIRSGA